ncbi:DUF5590 domain-containing protein [Paenibacillus mucilaginosus]|uniref:Cell wall elongation regulator TseB-like domain-containing protein n=1 Tax=Paenibacillus mucilaginosus (strain KNP414) TaxID=1036673 RepID=F8FCX5_PAEMK|nr:DUF5590 domain-containing protein [Paenibacillus mucilaginosus]AEI41392.1 hypothetical protein KNP414_02832 [Paenibacillus mucilaginosus KNP414]MCG7211190.1 DUF5590 domain-containing protein [Paenibacillus mucilaginosus]WDM30414.1 DUF5590 domain-containing protein [Paenibacillus mucilaginosus]
MRKRWKVLLLTCAAVTAVFAGGGIVFQSVMEPVWSGQRQAVQAAYEKTVLAKANKVEQFVGDETYTVITGEDKIGQGIFVFVAGDKIRTEPAPAGMNAEAAAAKVTGKVPGAEVLRVMPGIQNGAPVWEVFYKIAPEDKPEQYFYDYYTFTDGQPIDTWNLTLR